MVHNDIRSFHIPNDQIETDYANLLAALAARMFIVDTPHEPDRRRLP